MRDQLVQRMCDAGIVAIMRRTEASLAVDTARALAEGGVSVVEVTLNTPGAEDMLRALAKEVGDEMLIGAGTVMSAEEVRRAVDAGARFIVSPHTDPAVIEATLGLDAPSLPGAFTPTEIVRAWQLGASLVKVFPVGSVGPRYLRDVLAPLSEIPLVPTGGVTIENAADFVRAGARALGLGSDLVSPRAVAARDFAGIADRARGFVAAFASGREAGR